MENHLGGAEAMNTKVANPYMIDPIMDLYMWDLISGSLYLM